MALMGTHDPVHYDQTLFQLSHLVYAYNGASLHMIGRDIIGHNFETAHPIFMKLIGITLLAEKVSGITSKPLNQSSQNGNGGPMTIKSRRRKEGDVR